MIAANNNITQHQLELLKSFKYITSDTQINEVKELLHLYFKHKLDKAIDNAEKKNNYSQLIYEEWLGQKNEINFYEQTEKNF